MEVLILGTVNSQAIWGALAALALTAVTILVTNIWISKKKFNNE
jgi:ABC-2 type transport system permease protein